mmetsp:Transcript_32693/g.98849  ORF Transcript_32693/g.98849 Transcript_32693/m.98849 type:complete len:213 (-) Transcript_32693:96-734(-)
MHRHGVWDGLPAHLQAADHPQGFEVPQLAARPAGEDDRADARCEGRRFRAVQDAGARALVGADDRPGGHLAVDGARGLRRHGLQRELRRVLVRDVHVRSGLPRGAIRGARPWQDRDLDDARGPAEPAVSAPEHAAGPREVHGELLGARRRSTSVLRRCPCYFDQDRRRELPGHRRFGIRRLVAAGPGPRPGQPVRLATNTIFSNAAFSMEGN